MYHKNFHEAETKKKKNNEKFKVERNKKQKQTVRR